MAPSDVEVWRVPSPSRPCAYCRQDVGADPATSCPRCDAAYHADCWDSNLGRCAIYGCEPAPKITVPAAPVAEVPDVSRPAGGWAWLAPILVMVVLGIARLGVNDSSSRVYPTPPPFPPRVLRHMDQPLELDALLDVRGPVVPALPDDVPCLLEEAQALEDSASTLLELPPGRLTAEERTTLRQDMVADLTALKRAYRLIQRCDVTLPEAGFAVSLVRLATTIAAKRRLLLDLWTAKGTD